MFGAGLLSLVLVGQNAIRMADETRTRQILINLMGNAIKFADAGTVSVVVTESEDKVHIDVSDTGGEVPILEGLIYQTVIKAKRNRQTP